MKVLGIHVEAQYSQVQPDRSWKKVCMASDAALGEGEDASEARRALYAEVAEDLKHCFTNNRKARAKPPAGSETWGDPALDDPGVPMVAKAKPKRKPQYAEKPAPRGTTAKPAPLDCHVPGQARRSRPGKQRARKKNPSDRAWCYIHEVPMQEHTKKTKNGKTSRWYSHRLPDGTWCNDRAKKGKR